MNSKMNVLKNNREEGLRRVENKQLDKRKKGRIGRRNKKRGEGIARGIE